MFGWIERLERWWRRAGRPQVDPRPRRTWPPGTHIRSGGQLGTACTTSLADPELLDRLEVWGLGSRVDEIERDPVPGRLWIWWKVHNDLELARIKPALDACFRESGFAF